MPTDDRRGGIKNIQGLPDRQIMLIGSDQQASLGAQVLGGYIEQTSPAPAESPPS